MAVRRIAVTLPEELFEMVERLREIGHRCRSEVLQEALPRDVGEPVDEPLAEAEQTPDAGLPWSEARNGLLAE